MYRSGKQFMKDPATAACRIYIGNILDQVTTVDLDDRFKCYGTILGLVLQRGFGFIQFETEAQAQLAIKSEHGALFFGRKLNVRQALDKTKLNAPYNAKNQGPPQRNEQRPPMVKQDHWHNTPMESPPPAPSTQPPIQLKPKPLMEMVIAPPKGDAPSEQIENAKDDSVKNDDLEIVQETEVFGANRNSEISPDMGDRKRPLGGNRRGGGLNRGRQDNREFDRFSGDDFPPRTGAPQGHIPPRDGPPRDAPIREMPLRDGPMRDMPSRDGPPRDIPQRDVPLRDMPPRDVPPMREIPTPLRDIPPRDVQPMRDMPPREIPGRDVMFYGRDDNFRGPPNYIPPPIIERPERNDCEIIVVSRLLTEYAEYIEQKLKSIGLMVDLLYPNEDVPIGRVLANISSRGCLYAILVMPQNEEFRSMTLSILHGIPQEHRNIPVEDALALISRNFDAYMRGEKISPGAGVSLLDRHPESIQMIFNLLAENRQLTITQYEKVLKYLQDRKELQKQFEISEEGENDVEIQPNSKQAELQNRIMNILNKSTDDAPKPVEAPQASATPTPLLNDPSVQKALDSLLSGDMLKSIASGL